MSQDLFAAFNSLEPPISPNPVTQDARQPSPLRSARGAITPLSINSALRSPPTSTAVSAATTPVPPPEASSINDEDDDWGDFEDAAKSQAEPPAQVSAVPKDDLDDVLRARLGTPLDAKPDEYFFDTTKRSLPRSVSTAPKSPPPVQSPPLISKALPFKPRPSLERTQQKPTPPKATNLPFKPKPVEKDPKIGNHPFVGRMDFLFDAADEGEYDAGADDLNMDLAKDPEAAMAYSKKLIADQMAAKGVGKAREPSPKRFAAMTQNPKTEQKAKQQQRSPNKLRKKYAPPSNADVLFDVDDVSANGAGEDDDDWGGFEAKAFSPKKIPTIPTSAKPLPKTPVQQQETPAIDLLGLDDELPAAMTPPVTSGWSTALPSQTPSSNPPRPNLEDDNPWSEFSSAPLKKSATNANALHDNSIQIEDPWDDFSTDQPAAPPTQAPTSSRLDMSNLLIPPINTLANPPAPPINITPPTNIPPPALLLSLFPPLISRTSKSFFDSLAHLSASEKPALLATLNVQVFLRGHIELGTVLARILAGRKQRWKRDKFLAQSMRIGPAGSGGGMKLAGLDKSESAKEDREALDAVAAWSSIQARLRSAVMAANVSSSPPQPKLDTPLDVRDVLGVRALGQDAGGVMARAACGLCGLKREERVQGESGDDVFGEWWVEGWGGHRGCFGYWEGFKGDLGGR